MLPWPNRVPDLNPIEHVWDQLKGEVRDLQPTNVVVQVWRRIPQRKLQDYIGSMRARCNAVIAAPGGHTKY